MEILQVTTPREIDSARELFKEYAAGLAVSLCFQGFEAELAGLPGLSAPPLGRLLIAWADREAVGCVAMRPLAGGACEMKRLYVRPAFCGRGLGRRLAEKVIAEACSAGHTVMRLDTLPRMLTAIHLYETLGFKRRGGYYDTPLDETVFMELVLSANNEASTEG